MLNMTRAQLIQLRKKYFPFIILSGDEERAVAFVRELLDTEAAALKEHDPNAMAIINRLDAISYELSNIEQDLKDELFRDPNAIDDN